MKEKDKKEQNRKRKPGGDTPDIGVVRVFSNPGPDAENRLRRLLSLMVRYATGDGQAKSPEDSPPDDSRADDHAGEDA